MATNNAVDLTNTGIVVYDGAGTFYGRSITGTGGIDITNDDGVSGNINVDGSGISSPNQPQNLGISYSGGTFSVCSADGTALSGSNIGYVTMQDNTAGQIVQIPVTANQTFTDGSSGTIDNALLGLVSGDIWATDIPIFLYAVLNDDGDAVNFMVSRDPTRKISPVNTSISKTGSIINVDQSDFFSLGDVTITDYDENPCCCLGAFRMQFDGSTNSWTVQALNDYDGIGQFHEMTRFEMPSGVNGSAASTYFQSNAGTEPRFTTSRVYYWVNSSGNVKYLGEHNSCNVSGVGANELLPTLPARCGGGSGNDGYIFHFLDSATGKMFIEMGTMNGGAIYISGINASGFAPGITNANITTTDSFSYQGIYSAWPFTQP